MEERNDGYKNPDYSYVARLIQYANEPKMDFDIFLGGPPDRRSPFPYRQIIKAAFPDLRIYDWEEYHGDDYQERNHQMIRQSRMMVSLVPDFPMPGIGPEVGYFYAVHEEMIRAAKVSPIILIWPDSVKPDFTKKTIGHYGLIVPSVEEAIAAIKNSLADINKYLESLKKFEGENRQVHEETMKFLRDFQRAQEATRQHNQHFGDAESE